MQGQRGTGMTVWGWWEGDKCSVDIVGTRSSIVWMQWRWESRWKRITVCSACHSVKYTELSQVHTCWRVESRSHISWKRRRQSSRVDCRCVHVTQRHVLVQHGVRHRREPTSHHCRHHHHRHHLKQCLNNSYVFIWHSVAQWKMTAKLVMSTTETLTRWQLALHRHLKPSIPLVVLSC